MTPAVRPIRIPGATAMEALRQRAQGALDAWAREWLTDSEDRTPRLHIQLLEDASRAATHPYDGKHTETGSVWIRRSDQDRLEFTRRVVGSALTHGATCADEWICDAVDRAHDSLVRGLCVSLTGAPAASSTGPLSDSLFAFGTGAVQLSCASLGLQVIADDAVWHSTAALGNRQPKLTPLNRALHNCRVRIDVMLGAVALHVPRLLDLRTGDVIRLSQRLTDGSTIHLGGKPLAQVSIGAINGHKCVQLIGPLQSSENRE